MNSLNKRKYIVALLIVTIIFITMVYITRGYESRSHISSVNDKFSSIIALIKDKYPDVDEKQIINELNSYKKDFNLSKYGINVKNEYADINLNRYSSKFLYIYIAIVGLFLASLLLIVNSILRNYKHGVDEIIYMIDEINNKNYNLDMDSIDEDDLSKLKSEIQKTAIILKEQFDNSVIDKLNIKDSLSDISHQIKTPLTSIMIMLDNLLDNPNMELIKREEFLLKIKREIKNISFLTNSILKLSRFDSSTVNYNKSEVKVSDIVEKSIQNVSLLCDLKNIKINVDLNSEIKLVCDLMWQVEAITNLLKNAIESSNEGSCIDIIVSDNRVYTELRIRDYGVGIDKKDLPYIFDRFYRGTNSSHDSIGIGLALTKAIIEKNGGNVSVAQKDSGAEFIIKYYK